MKNVLFIAVLAGCVLLAWAAPPVSLEQGFRNPPPQARLRCYWWWLNSNVTKEAITRDLEQMKAKGFAGAIIIDAGGAEQRGNAQVPAGPIFAGPQWRDLFRHTLAEANRLGLEISLNIQSGWNLGGPTVKPEEAAKQSTWSRVQVTGPSRFDGVLEAPPRKLDFYRDVAAVAYPLKHGAAPQREPIRQFDFKASLKEAGFSTPDTRPLLTDVPARPGEEDTMGTRVIDLTARMQPDGRLSWQVPEGEWELLRFGYTASGARVSTSSQPWQGLALDYLDRGALESYWRQVVAPLIADAGPLAGRTFKYLVTDSWELGGVNWTANFRDEFRKRRGYDPLPYLPVFAGRLVDSREASNRFLNDLRRTIGDLVAERHYAVFAELAGRHGMGIHCESGGPHGAPVDALLNLGLNAFPQMEFWAQSKTHRVRDEDRFFVKEAASAAHIYGKTLVAAEGFTTIGPHWEESIWDNLKPSFDRAVCEGLNLLIWHTFTCSPRHMGKPGQEYFAGTHFNPNITWWEQSSAFLSYINRIQFMAQQGLFVADVLYYYGDHVPNFVRLKPSDPAGVLPGYDYDVCNEDVLLRRLSVKNGRITLPDGMSYALLVLPDVDVISPAALRRVRDLVREGATVIGKKPQRSTGLRGDDEVARISAELWGGQQTGKGRVIAGRTARQVLAADGLKPDFEFTAQPGANLDYIHRRTPEADIYFVSNQGDRPEVIDAIFRVTGKAPELWFPETGEIRRQAFFRATDDGRTTLPLPLHAYGSAFVVFRKPAGDHFISVAKDGRPAAVAVWIDGNRAASLVDAEPGQYRLTHSTGRSVTVTVPPAPEPRIIAGPWNVRFAPGWGAPAAVLFESLASWTQHADGGVKYFSGTAAYEKEIEVAAELLRPHHALELDLGEVRELAEVILNGRNLGILWKPPRRVDMTGVVRPGKNRLEIRVTNLWPNRIIGDQFLPEPQRLTRTNIRKFTKESPLLPSGLLGPVVLRSVARTNVPALPSKAQTAGQD
jgi:hypothetical protein